MHPLISIVVPVYNQSGVTVQCFNSIRKNTQLPFELIWVDNGSSKDEFTVISRQAKLPGTNCVVLRNKENLGFIKATNQGISHATGKFIILLNNDTEVSPNWDKQLIQPLERNEEIGAVGPITHSRIAWQTAEYINSRWGLAIPEYKLIGKKKYPENLEKRFAAKYLDVTDVDLTLAFFCTAIPKTVFEKLGSLCEEFSIGLGDDDEYCARLRAYGYRLLVSLGTFVYHYHRTTFSSIKIGEESLRKYNSKVLKRKIAALKCVDTR